MRFVEVLLHPTEGAFHPIEEAIRDSPELEPRAIHQFSTHDDGTVLMLYEVEGDLEDADEIFETQPGMISYDVTASDSGVMAYLHFESADTAVGELFSFLNRNDVLVDPPLRYETDDDGAGALRARIIGNGQAIQCAATNAPSGVWAEIVDSGDYARPVRDVLGSLTDRQREVLDAAVRVGYFDSPREATLDDVAEEVGLAVPTVSEHLRKVSAKVFGSP